MERTLILIKPDAVQRAYVGRIITKLEEKGLKLVALKMLLLDEALLSSHYAHLLDKPFFKGIAEFMQKTPVIACIWEGLDSVDTVRRACGITKAREAELGTIRGDLAMSIQANIVHASDSKEAALDEIKRFFLSEEIFDYDLVLAPFIYSSDELLK